MKLPLTALFLCLLLHFPVAYLTAQKPRDSIVNNRKPDYKIYRVPKQNRTDTVPRPNKPVPPVPRDNDKSNADKPQGGYIIPDTIRPVPVETHTYIRSVLRLQKIYVNKDALELIQLLNPRLAKMQTVMSNYRLVLPVLPEPDSKSNKSVNQQFKRDLDPDGNANNVFIGAALQLDTLAGIFNSTNFQINDANDQRDYSFIKNLLPALSDLNKRAIRKIDHTSKKTVNTLTTETNALNNVLAKCNNTSTLSGEDIDEIHALIVDMNILLYSITDRKLQIPREWSIANYYNKPFNYSLASYNLTSNNSTDLKSTLSDDDPRKFNIYVFRRGLVENGKKDPEMKIYTVSYAIPALAADKDEWTVIPEPASTVHCYFAPARFNFKITDNGSGEEYSATEDLYDAQKDPNEKWTLIDLFDRHPTYRLIFLIP